MGIPIVDIPNILTGSRGALLGVPLLEELLTLGPFWAAERGFFSKDDGQMTWEDSRFQWESGWWARATPLKNMSQLGWWHKPNMNGKITLMATKPTNQEFVLWFHGIGKIMGSPKLRKLHDFNGDLSWEKPHGIAGNSAGGLLPSGDLWFDIPHMVDTPLRKSTDLSPSAGYIKWENQTSTDVCLPGFVSAAFLKNYTLVLKHDGLLSAMIYLWKTVIQNYQESSDHNWSNFHGVPISRSMVFLDSNLGYPIQLVHQDLPLRTTRNNIWGFP